MSLAGDDRRGGSRAAGSAEPAGPGDLLAFLKRDDASVYIGPSDTRQFSFVGYFEEVLALLSGRLFSKVCALRAVTESPPGETALPAVQP